MTMDTSDLTSRDRAISSLLLTLRWYYTVTDVKSKQKIKTSISHLKISDNSATLNNVETAEVQLTPFSEYMHTVSLFSMNSDGVPAFRKKK